jgi:hypothetical protein
MNEKNLRALVTTVFVCSFKGEGLQNLGQCSVLRAFEQGGIFIMPRLL